MMLWNGFYYQHVMQPAKLVFECVSSTQKSLVSWLNNLITKFPWILVIWVQEFDYLITHLYTHRIRR